MAVGCAAHPSATSHGSIKQLFIITPPGHTAASVTPELINIFIVNENRKHRTEKKKVLWSVYI